MSSITCFLLQNILLEFVINIVSRVPGATYPAMKFIFEVLQLFSPQNRVDVSDEILVVETTFLFTARQLFLCFFVVVFVFLSLKLTFCICCILDEVCMR